MKIKALLTSSVIVSGLLSGIAFSKPTEDYPNNLALLKHEKGIHYKRAWRRTVWPLPIPFVLNNVISGTNGWKKYNKANKMYRLYKSSQIIADTIENDKDQDNKKYQKAYNRVHHALLKLQKESREAAASKNGIVERMESQKALDDKVRDMTTEDLALLLNDANKTIPPACGKPEAGHGNFNGHNLRFKIRTVSLYKENISMLEEEISLEHEKMADHVGQNEDELEAELDPAPDQEQNQEQGQEVEPGKVEPAPLQEQNQETEPGKVESAPSQEQNQEAEPGKVEPAPQQEQGQEAEPGKVEPAPSQEQDQEAESGKVEPAPQQEETQEGQSGKVDPAQEEDSISISEDTDEFEERLRQVELELANQASQ
ncbi:MAG: hypothetical protein AB8G05_14785 [Oligoflexales bacterium]